MNTPDNTDPVVVLVPPVPSHLRRADGDWDLRVCDLGDDALREIGRQWTRDLIVRAAEMRKEPVFGH